MYQVFRSRGGDRFSPLVPPLSGTSIKDTTATWGRKYFYKVQTLTVHGKAVISGGVTEPVAAVPVDLTPPAPPIGLTASITATGWKLLWIQIHERDLAGFRIYRRLDGSNDWKLLGEVEKSTSMFIDDKLPAKAQLWYYAITSIDNSEPPNESERSVEAKGRR